MNQFVEYRLGPVDEASLLCPGHNADQASNCQAESSGNPAAAPLVHEQQIGLKIDRRRQIAPGIRQFRINGCRNERLAIERLQQIETAYPREVQDGGCVGDNDSKAFWLAHAPKILAEVLNAVMNRNPALRRQRLKGELADLREAARLREGQPLLLEQRQGKLLLKLRFGDVSRCESEMVTGIVFLLLYRPQA